MKYLSTALILSLVTITTACGGGGGGENNGSDTIFTENLSTGPNSEDFPSVSVSDDVAHVNCDEDWVTEDGATLIECIDSEGDEGASLLVACNLGMIDLILDDALEVQMSTSCLSIHCGNDGDITYTSCDEETGDQ